MDRRRPRLRAVVDTNVVAYFLLGTQPFVDETTEFWQAATETMAPAIWEAEVANVVWMAIRSGVIPAAQGPRRLDLAARLGIHSITSRTLWHGAFSRAVESGLAVYDALFVELASREHIPLVTFDKRILSAFSDIAKRPHALLRRSPRDAG